ncbi:hypothetical protein OE88DRAFT_1316757 [Heliocybe sulcata]|uniref:Uncharacterized protein n=1 Tax=Heliocybe sulcata TaxID=5364 RepID=A0A5C3N699_9AGAM|nr:hypothetical protein OE88DRAFT_1316757 [Heliocybe sulcata]
MEAMHAYLNVLTASPLLAASTLGILSHWLLFVRGEWNRYVTQLFWTSISLPALVYLSLLVISGQSWLTGIHVTLKLCLGYYAGLFASMLLYRAFFHPIRSFPGPFAARLTAFWSLKKQIPVLHWYKNIHELHHQYGDFVRIRRRSAPPCLSSIRLTR